MSREAEAYDRWLRAKVRKALTSRRPRIDHEDMMRRIEILIEEKSGASRTR